MSASPATALPPRARRAALVRGAALVLAGTLLILTATSCSPSPDEAAAPPELHVAAANSTRDVLERVAPDFEQEHGVTLVFNYGASGVLQRQIEAGAPVDVFVSASPACVDALVADAFVAEPDTVVIARNDLAVVVPRGNPAGIEDPQGLQLATLLATGNPRTAPHGTMTREWLVALGLWTQLEPRFVFGENAAQTLDYVARGEVDAAVTFASEAVGREAVEVAFTVPPSELEPAEYVAAPVAGTTQRATADAFIAYLLSASAQDALVASGFRSVTELRP